jgi:hypothetical protein
MDLIVAFAAGVVFTMILRVWRSRVARSVARPPEQPLAARLQSLVGPLAAAGDASAHPRDLLDNPTFGEAVGILASDSTPIEVVTDNAVGANFMLSTAAFAALVKRSDRQSVSPQMERHFRHLGPWPVFFALRYFATLAERPPVGALVLHVPEYWPAHPLVPSMFAEHFAARTEMGDAPQFGESLADTTPEELTVAESLLGKIDHPTSKTLIAELTAWRLRTLDRPFLQAFGRFLEQGPEMELLVEHKGVKEQLAAAEDSILQEPGRSVLVIGEPSAGKTSFLMLLTKRAAARGWTVFEAGAASLMAGQQTSVNSRNGCAGSRPSWLRKSACCGTCPTFCSLLRAARTARKRRACSTRCFPPSCWGTSLSPG